MYKIYIFMQKKLIRILARALHEYVNFVHDPEKQYRSLSEWSATGVYGRVSSEIFYIGSYLPHVHNEDAGQSIPRRTGYSISGGLPRPTRGADPTGCSVPAICNIATQYVGGLPMSRQLHRVPCKGSVLRWELS